MLHHIIFVRNKNREKEHVSLHEKDVFTQHGCSAVWRGGTSWLPRQPGLEVVSGREIRELTILTPSFQSYRNVSYDCWCFKPHRKYPPLIANTCPGRRGSVDWALASNKKVTSSIPWRAPAWVVGQVVWEATDWHISCTSMFLCPSFSLPSQLFENQYNL